MRKFLGGIYSFYRDGFQRMTVGKTLWKLIFIKLFVMFAILKVFFFPNYLNTNFSTEEEKADHVAKQLTRGVGKTIMSNNGGDNG